MRRIKHVIWIARFDRVAVRRMSVAISLAGLAAGIASPAWAQYAINRFTVAGGGNTRDLGGPYTLASTIGQAMAGQMTGGGYSLGSGFWGGGGGGSAAIEPDEGEAAGAIPLVFRLYPTAPNPLAVGRSMIAFDLPQPGAVRVLVYDVTGRLTRALVDEALPAGRHQRTWDGSDDDGHRVAAGIYFLHVHTEEVRAEQKIVVLK
jgi:FlgD Ig-like domain